MSGKSWAFFENDAVTRDDELWLTQKPRAVQNRNDSDVFIVKSIVPSRPIPIKIKQEDSPPPVKIFANKATSTMITADHLITLEDHEAILVQVLEQRIQLGDSDNQKQKPIKLKKLVKPKEIEKLPGKVVFH